MVFYFKLNCSLFFEIGLRPMLTKYFIEYREIGKNIIKFYVLYDQTNSVLILPESCAFRNVQYSETQNTSNYMYKQVIWISFDTLFKLFSIFSTDSAIYLCPTAIYQFGSGILIRSPNDCRHLKEFIYQYILEKSSFMELPCMLEQIKV